MRRFMLKLIRGYQAGISPYSRPRCRFTPTCSEYAYQAISLHGAWKGFWMALYRLLRCNPFCKGGYDPVKYPHDEIGCSHENKENIYV
ncbi:MAG: membrane protein insertion efficiency factor YidD [Clostridiaceae bacterium]|nr:membrane protein insertion efficiency factor YidD [Clostridiaceae bacterium]